jgi:cytochrome c-type biogenesis protein CcmH/NrfG
MTELKTRSASDNNGLLKELPPRRRRFLESRMKKVQFAPGTRIIEQGQTGDFLGIVEIGQVKLENGRAQARTLAPGDSFGSEMLRFGKPSAYTITAQTDTVLQVLDRADWLSPSPPPQPRTLSSGMPRLKKSGRVALFSSLILAMVVLVLGPTLLDYSNARLPDRLAETGRYDQAQGYLEFAIRLQPDSANLYGKLGDILALQEQDQDAIEAYQQAITLDEYLPWIHNNLGVLLLEEGFYALARDHFQRALELNPENTSAFQNLGNAYYAQDQWQATADAYQKALELDFTLLDTKAAWAGLILYENRLVEARLVWEDVLQADPRHPLALQGLGIVALLEDDPSLALMYLDAARYLNPGDPITYLYIGMAWEVLDKPEEAAEEYQYVLESGTDPELLGLATALLEVVAD